mmetsp:Transcript_16868/g.51962  ORF Transcript_16868/g.51962 Transcript_16868/m.51962 type:complete len:212 (-) Transcript_16868:62-697(-)
MSGAATPRGGRARVPKKSLGFAACSSQRLSTLAARSSKWVATRARRARRGCAGGSVKDAKVRHRNQVTCTASARHTRDVQHLTESCSPWPAHGCEAPTPTGWCWELTGAGVVGASDRPLSAGTGALAAPATAPSLGAPPLPLLVRASVGCVGAAAAAPGALPPGAVTSAHLSGRRQPASEPVPTTIARARHSRLPVVAQACQARRACTRCA